LTPAPPSVIIASIISSKVPAVPHQFIAELTEGVQVKQCFLVRRVESRTTKGGKPFLNLVLADVSGTIDAKVWGETLKRCPGPFAPADFVAIQGQVESFQGDLQINVQYLNTVEALQALGRELPDFDPAQLIPSTVYDREQMLRELNELVAEHLNPPLKELVLSLLSKHASELLEAPGARNLHHPYLGGLLEHTWFVSRLAFTALGIYPDLHRDLVLAGAILHDLGKLKELANPRAPERTREGELLGHVVLGWEMVREAARSLEFPDPTLLVQLEHILLSHHGSLEFGSPVVPKTREALLVYFLDDLDAKLKMMTQHLESDAGDSEFTSYHRVLQRGLYKGGESPPAGGRGQGKPDK
jgi:3'-5' exoribonuclease